MIRIDVDQPGRQPSATPRAGSWAYTPASTEEWSGVGYYIPNDNPFLDP